MHIVRSTRRRAISLIEVCLFIVISMAVTTGGIIYFQQASFQQKIVDVEQYLKLMTTGIQDNVLKDPNLPAGTDLWGMAIRAGYVPKNGIFPLYQHANDGGYRMKHPFGGSNQRIAFSTHPNKAYLWIGDLPRRACMRLGLADEKRYGTVGKNIERVVINRGAPFPETSMTPPVTPEHLGIACDEGGSVAIYFDRADPPDP